MTLDLAVAIVHYHLRPGGVTGVIEQTVETLDAHGIPSVVLTGEPSPVPLEYPLRFHLDEDLGYRSGTAHAPVDEVVKRLRRTAEEALGEPPKVWHFHNHALGKNLNTPLVVEALARDGAPLLLQLHDFLEDGRPENYRRLLQHIGRGDPDRLAAVLYPQAPHVHYAALNGRDAAFLKEAGVKPERIHCLPNSVYRPRETTQILGRRREGRAPVYLYPTRAIRRKNLGEFLLWAALAEQGVRFAVTLSPRNPAARGAYERWVALAENLKLPVDFEVGAGASVRLASLLQEAHAAVSTSVAEGFGLCFLEPWLQHCPVIGRKLPEITSEFEAEGVDLSGCYTSCPVPIEWVGGDHLRRVMAQGMKATFASYGRTGSDSNVEDALQAALEGETVDFGRLDETLQEHVIDRVVVSRDAAQWLRARRIFPAEVPQETIEANSDCVRREYSLERYGENLLLVYEDVMASPKGPVEALNGNALLDRFLSPERFFLLRT
ncbi:MAG: glycosyltransferase family 4 protein [Planctomycetota bacterium]